MATRIRWQHGPLALMHTLPCPISPSLALPCPALPYPTLPCPALPYPTLSYPTLPCPALPCPPLPSPPLSSLHLPYLHLIASYLAKYLRFNVKFASLAHQALTCMYPGFCTMKRLGLFYSPRRDASLLQGYPQH